MNTTKKHSYVSIVVFKNIPQQTSKLILKLAFDKSEIMAFLFIAVGCAFGFVIAFLFFKNKNSVIADTSVLDNKIVDLERAKLILETNLSNKETEILRLSSDLKSSQERFSSELKEEREKVTKAETRNARAEEVFKVQKETILELKDTKEKFTKEFENIANKILDEKSQKFTDQNKTNLDIILNPLKERIKDFESKVEKAYKTESDERITLKAEIKNLIDGTKQISDEANNLAKALKGDNKKQGNWGEVILEKVLERSGLVKGQEYVTQFSTSNSEGSRIQPDAVIKLPDDKHIIVDAKVSLIAYEACVNSSSDEDREKFTKEHLLSVRNHVKLLSSKEYQSSSDFNTPDFVLLFIPIESSFSVAVQADQELFSFAWDKKIVIVSPSTLLATLRTISSLWKQERQTKNVLEIARQGGELYDKFVGFLEDMQKIEKGIEQSGKAYQDAINKLSTGNGNLVRRIENIRKLGGESNKTKEIPSKFLDNDTSAKLIDETESL